MKSSGHNCAVYNCLSSQKKVFFWKKHECKTHIGMLQEDCPCLVPYQFHRFPKNEEMFRQWKIALNRKDYQPGKSARVCSLHFLEGRPTKENPIPQLNLGYSKKVVKGRIPLKRVSAQVDGPSPKTSKRNAQSSVSVESVSEDPQNTGVDNTDSVERSSVPVKDVYVLKKQVEVCNQACQVTLKTQDASTQYEDVTCHDHTYACNTGFNFSYTSSVKTVGTQADGLELNANNLTTTDCSFYTGLRLDMFLYLVGYISQHGKHLKFLMNISDQLLLVLMRLRLGLLFYDLGRRFKISTSLASAIFNSWIPIMACNLKGLISWLPRETIRMTLPKCFENFYPRTTCILDCTEVNIQRPSFLKSRAVTYSSYKSNNTLKFLVAIAPHGYIMFVSKCYGGRASDKHIFLDCGVLDRILPNDEIMVDRGFTIEEEVESKHAKVNIPAFTKNRIQLTEKEVTETRRIASVRIHVERAIGRLKCFRILKNVMVVKNLHNTADNIITVCTALTNLRAPLIKNSE